MRRFISTLILIVFVLVLSSSMTVFAANGSVTYNGESGDFIFAPGSEYSPTDLFLNFKDVMPGDSITQDITVRNDESKNVKVKIYIRSLGAHEGSEGFLSQLNLSVKKAEENEMAYMFDAAADQTAGLTDWVYLGTLYSGGEVNLNVILDVPTTLDNNYKDLIGFIDWQFMIEELPVEPDDPQPPQTGDTSNLTLWFTLMISSAAMLIILLFWKRREKEEEEPQKS